MKDKIIIIIIIFAVLSIRQDVFSALFTFSPRLSAAGSYTDNVNLTVENKEDDFIILLSGGFTAQLLGKTSGAELSFDTGYAFYDQNQDYDAFRIPLDFKAWASPTKNTTLQFTNKFLRTEDPVPQNRIVSGDDRIVEEGDTTVRRGRDPYYRNTAGFQATHRFGQRDRIYAELFYGLLRNDNEQVEDNDNYTAAAGLDYEFTHWFGTELYGAFTRGEFFQQDGFVGEPSSDFDNLAGSARFLGRITKHFSLFFQYDQVHRSFDSSDSNDYRVYAPSAGFTYDITESISSRLGLGYYYQDIEQQEDQKNLFLNAAISKIWNYQRGVIDISGLAGLTQNDFGVQNLGFQQFAAIQGFASYDFTRRIVGDVGGYYRISNTPGQSDGTANTEQKDRIDNIVRLNAGIEVLPTRWMKVRAGYSFTYNDSNIEEGYNENRAMLTITLEPEQPWRL